MRVSFDFDNTLDIPKVQEYAKKLINDGLEVWIYTSRYDTDEAIKRFHSSKWNDDLFKIAREVGIPLERIRFTNMELKSELIKGKDILWHLDDDTIEVDFINEDTFCIGVERSSKNDWLKECNEIINNNINLNEL